MKNLDNTDLKASSIFLRSIRAFFESENILEVITPTLLNYPTLDSNIDNITLTTNRKYNTKEYYLHTSPELEMKKLLGVHNNNIYQLSKVYRDNEIGKHNTNEFMMLEYYLINANMDKFICHTHKLFHTLGITHSLQIYTYNELLNQYAHIDSSLSYTALKKFATLHGLTTTLSHMDLQLLIWTHFVDPHLKKYPLLVVTDFPKEQSAYAKVVNNIAKRFEIYLDGIEIANGYEELQTYEEYLEIFTQQSKQSGHAINTEFLKHIKQHPLPPCSGVAIGVERLFCSVKKTHNIKEKDVD